MMNLQEKYYRARMKKGPAYQPRTRHIAPDGWAKYTNRLFLESSPYLTQHAHNPVDWYPWGDEAFETAREKDRPVLLSVGYSTCHWCHVMEEESFEDEEIADFINQHYIAVKVDREERPDVDAIYMTAVQALTGRGGWPMTVWLTADRQPFFGGTYFPARDGDRGGSIGFLTLLKKIRQRYDTHRDVITRSGSQVTSAIRRLLNPDKGHSLPGENILKKTIELYRESFDAIDGGLQGAPKFPSSLSSRLLLRYDRRNFGADVLDMARLTLDKMSDGGMYDHVGGGFHRYSTDVQWLAPHFEKMLYDNALLVVDYLEAYQVLKNERYRQTAEETLAYVQRDMTAPGGAFYSATDADSLTPDGHREEGYFFTWTHAELEGALGKNLYPIIKQYYCVEAKPNFEGRHILFRKKTDPDIAQQLNITENDLINAVNRSKTILRTTREQRPLPLRDEKILTAWNGLMISAFAKAGFVLNNESYTASAVKAADFLLKNMVIDGRLYRSFNDDRARHKAYLDDYAFLIASLLDLYETTGDFKWFKNAVALERVLADHYEDQENGGFFMTADDHEALIAREKPNHDGAIPSGNAVAAMNLLRFSEFTTDPGYVSRAEKVMASLTGVLDQNPAALASLLLALDFHLNNTKTIILIVPQGGDRQAELFLDKLRSDFVPNRVLAVIRHEDRNKQLEKAMPITQGRTAIDDRVTAHVCENNTCKLPTTDPVEFERQIKLYAYRQ